MSNKKKVETCGVIIYTIKDDKTFILLGQTGIYLSDDKNIKDYIIDLEYQLKSKLESNLITSYSEIRLYQDYTTKLSDYFQIPLHYTREGKFLKIDRLKSSITIPKGGKEYKETDKETDKETAIREVEEETGCLLQPKKLVEMKKGYFSYEIDKKELEELKDSIHTFEKYYYGELFNLKFYNINELNKSLNLNTFTKESIQLFKNLNSPKSPKSPKSLKSPKSPKSLKSPKK
jgi:8-oxo-dGTP pyrophosphatase MutT (NUDIX family)